MKGKVFVVEAGDASGKATQANRLYSRLARENYNVRKVEFPNYKSDSSALVKMYLNGEFGKDPNDVNAYAASAFYAVDRFATYTTEWKPFYLDGGIIIADRYTTSNMVHQASKIFDAEEKTKYLDWLCDLEYEKFGLPKPDCVIFLDMPPEYSHRLMSHRNNKITGEFEKDIHEKNYSYLVDSYKNSCMIADKYGWKRISCVENGNIRTIEDIHEEIFRVLKPYLDN